MSRESHHYLMMPNENLSLMAESNVTHCLPSKLDGPMSPSLVLSLSPSIRPRAFASPPRDVVTSDERAKRMWPLCHPDRQTYVQTRKRPFLWTVGQEERNADVRKRWHMPGKKEEARYGARNCTWLRSPEMEKRCTRSSTWLGQLLIPHVDSAHCALKVAAS